MQMLHVLPKGTSSRNLCEVQSLRLHHGALQQRCKCALIARTQVAYTEVIADLRARSHQRIPCSGHLQSQPAAFSGTARHMLMNRRAGAAHIE